MWNATVLSLFPEMFPGTLDFSIAGKALRKKLWSLKTVNIRQFSNNKNGKVDEKAFQEFMTVGNDSSLLSNANFWLAETYYVRENYKDAAKNYLSLYQVYPDSKKAADALLKLGISLVNMDQKEQGCVTFIQLKDTYPNANTAVLDRGKLEIEKNGCEIS